MRKTFIIGIMILLSLSVHIVMAQQPVFRIGVLDDVNGSLSKGASLAVQEVNAAGGVRGADGTFFRIELVVQSTAGGAQTGTAIANLGQASIIAAVGPATNTEVLNNLQQLQSLNIPVLSPATNDSLLIADATDRLFRSRSAQILLGQALATFLVNDRNVTAMTAVQLDVDSTDSVVGFSSAAQALGITPQILLLQSEITDLATIISQSNSPAVAVFGPPAPAAELLNVLRQIGWSGAYAYDQATADGFKQDVSPGSLSGVLSTMTWPYTATDSDSDMFLGNYVRTFGEIPDSLAAASYDSIKLLALAIGLPGELLTNLRGLDNVQGVQGLLRPAQLSPGELSNNVAVVQLNALGVPQVAARYAGGVRLTGDQPLSPATATPVPTATPDGVIATVAGRPFQNVRTGPSTQFDVLGPLNEGEQARVIGTNRSLTWVVIEYRGRQGWMSAPLLEIFGDLRTVPIIDSPPTPTPAATSTPAPPQEADIIIESASVIPSPIIVGQPFTVTVTVRNIGNTNAGSFAIAATFPPNDVYASSTINGIAAGQAITTTLTGTLTNTGVYTVVIVADLNNQVPEGPGESNNSNFGFSYTVDKPVLNQGSQTLNGGATIDLESNAVQGDANWNGADLNAINGAQLGIINNANFTTIHWDLLNPSIINQSTIPGGSINPGTIIGIRTADGNRGVMRIDSRNGSQITVTFRVYQN